MNGTPQFSCLIVDDDPTVRSSLSLLLRMLTISTTEAQDGATALKKIAETPFQMILLDLKMPGLNGFDVLSELRHLAISIPVIVMSGHADDRELNRARAYGATEILKKPFDFEVLKLTVEMIRERAHRESGLDIVLKGQTKVYNS